MTKSDRLKVIALLLSQHCGNQVDIQKMEKMKDYEINRTGKHEMEVEKRDKEETEYKSFV
jgi:hypothetical protein